MLTEKRVEELEKFATDHTDSDNPSVKTRGFGAYGGSDEYM